MSFLVAGIVLVVALIAAVASYLSIPFYKDKTDSDSGDLPRHKITPAAFSRFFIKGDPKKVAFVCAAALLCAAVAYISHKSGSDTFIMLRQIVVTLLFLSAMIVDKDTRKIPNILVIIGFLAGAILLGIEFFTSRDTILPSLAAYVVGGCGCLVLFYILARLTKDGVGMGDVKLIAITGWMLGLATTIFVVLVAMIFCSLYAVFLLIWKKMSKNKTVPFGPFLFWAYILLLVVFNIL